MSFFLQGAAVPLGTYSTYFQNCLPFQDRSRESFLVGHWVVPARVGSVRVECGLQREIGGSPFLEIPLS